MEATLVNPLALPVEYRVGVTPLHDADDADRLADLTASMEDGWHGAPVVADRELRDAGQDKAYTGSHRLAAWDIASDGAPVPCVWIEDIAASQGIDWAALMDEHDGDSYDAANELCYRLSTEIREAYGLDVGGA
jgi:hypothetical protein